MVGTKSLHSGPTGGGGKESDFPAVWELRLAEAGPVTVPPFRTGRRPSFHRCALNVDTHGAIQRRSQHDARPWWEQRRLQLVPPDKRLARWMLATVGHGASYHRTKFCLPATIAAKSRYRIHTGPL